MSKPSPSVREPRVKIELRARPSKPASAPLRSMFPSSLRPTASSLRPAGEASSPPPSPAPRARRSTTVRVGIACAVALGLGMLWEGASRMLASEEAPRSPGVILVAGRAATKSTEHGAQHHWRRGTVQVTLDPSLDDVGPRAKDAVREAFGTWLRSGARLPKLKFDTARKSGRAAQDGVNLVLRAPITLEGHERDVAVTIGYVYARTGRIVEADIVFNAAYEFDSFLPERERESGRGGGRSRKRGAEHKARAEADEADDVEEADDGADDDERLPASSCSGRYDLASLATHEVGHFFGLGEDTTSRLRCISGRPRARRAAR